MKNKNGFVFMETLVVISVLSITLMMLFSSYSYILKKSRTKNTFDTTESIYKTFYVNQVLNDYKKSNLGSGVAIEYYAYNNLKSHGGECYKQTYEKKYSFICDLSDDNYDGYLKELKRAFEVDKIYYLNPYEIINSKYKEAWLREFDATTIDYIKELSGNTNSHLLIVKYKKIYNKDLNEYEVIHSSMEVNG